MMKLNLAALLAASAVTFAGGAALAAPQDHSPPKAEARGPHHDMIDLNKDGSISKDEWMKAAAARFEKFDVSKDGKISREEMRFGRFEEMQHMRHMRGGRGWHHGGPQGGPGREGPGGPGGPGAPRHRMGPPPPPPADAPTPPAN